MALPVPIHATFSSDADVQALRECLRAHGRANDVSPDPAAEGMPSFLAGSMMKTIQFPW